MGVLVHKNSLQKLHFFFLSPTGRKRKIIYVIFKTACYSFIIQISLVSALFLMHSLGRNQEVFTTGKVSWNKGTSKIISFTTHERKASQVKKFRVFFRKQHFNPIRPGLFRVRVGHRYHFCSWPIPLNKNELEI